MKKLTIIFLLCLVASPAVANESVVNERLSSYKTEASGAFDANRGKQMWSETHTQIKSGKSVSCASCHTADLTRTGSHARTGKVIEPLAPSMNSERLTDATKIEKWFLRNCKWTLGRECTAQEKGDFLTYINSQ